MRPRLAVAAIAWMIASLAVRPDAAGAQQWNDPRTMALVDLAIARRAAQLADTGLTDYRANAHGYLTFLAQVGEGFPDPPKLVRTDELAVEVYWRSPNQSKQRMVGRRDTLLLPTDINYHRDHLAIIQNNFPSIIRLGDGDEVRDVPHPLSAGGRDAYDFVIADSLLIRANGLRFDVVMVKVRPKDDHLARAVGAVYLDRANGTVVRMTFSFTRAALKDPQLEDVNIILENGLVDGRFWLPRRQEIEITRTSTWMDFPARGIIRGRWEICCVQVNNSMQSTAFSGPEIVTVSPAQLRAYPFKGGILEGLPGDVKLSDNDDVRRVQAEARELVRAEAIARTRRTVPGGRSVSDFARVNRNEGLAVGGTLTRLLGAGLSAQARVRFGSGDHAFKEIGTLAWQRASGVGVSASGGDDFREAGDDAETSGARNSIAAQEFASDLSDYYRARGAALTVGAGTHGGLRWSVAAERERQEPLGIHAAPANGTYRPAFAADAVTAWRLTVGASSLDAPGPFGSSARIRGGLLLSRVRFEQGARAGTDGAFARMALAATLERPLGSGRLALQANAAGVAGGDVPAQSRVFFGGPVTGPGYDYHALAGNAGISAHAEWRHELASVPVHLGRFGSLSLPVTVAPLVHAVWMNAGGTPGGASGWYPAAGVGVITAFDLLRLDIARGLRSGRWTFGIDLSRDFWRIL